MLRPQSGRQRRQERTASGLRLAVWLSGEASVHVFPILHLQITLVSGLPAARAQSESQLHVRGWKHAARGSQAEQGTRSKEACPQLTPGLACFPGCCRARSGPAWAPERCRRCCCPAPVRRGRRPRPPPPPTNCRCGCPHTPAPSPGDRLVCPRGYVWPRTQYCTGYHAVQFVSCGGMRQRAPVSRI